MLVTGAGGREDPYLGSVEGVVGPWRACLCTVHRGTFHFVISSYLQPVHSVCVHQDDAAEEMEESGGLWLVPGSADGATNHTAVFKRACGVACTPSCLPLIVASCLNFCMVMSRCLETPHKPAM